MPTDRDERDERDDEFRAGIFYGPEMFPRRRRGMGQVPASEQIRQLMMESLPPAMEEGAKRIGKQYETVGTVVVASLVVTAVATATIAVLMVLDRS